MVMDGVGRSLNIDLDLYSIMQKDIKKIVQDNFSKDEILEEALWAGKDILGLVRLLPRHAKWFLREWSKKKYVWDIRIKGHREGLEQVGKSLIFLGHGILASALFICGTIILAGHEVHSTADIPPMIWTFWGIALLITIKGFFSHK